MLEEKVPSGGSFPFYNRGRSWRNAPRRTCIRPTEGRMENWRKITSLEAPKWTIERLNIDKIYGA